MNERELFIAAMQIEDARLRSGYLEENCGQEPELRQRIEALIKAFGEAGSFLQHPPAEPVATLDLPPTERLGAQIGSYKLIEEIGQGGMGVVYMAEQKEPVRRQVALKIVKPGMDSRQVIARFDAERQALAIMDHPNIARIFDAGTTEQGRPYFVMELVRGIPINEFCDQKRLTVRARLELFLQVCQAVQHAHQKGIIHRDLKPTNVLVTLLDVLAVPKVIDFGIAKAFGPQLTDHTQVTGFAQFVGTPLYMSPEQAEMNQLGVDTRSDVYSLGVMLYELLTGTTPVDKEMLKTSNFDELRRMLREDDPPRPSARISTLDARALSTVSERRCIDPRRITTTIRGELDWIVMKALEKDRSRRYESASTLAADIQRYLNDEPVQACPPTIWYRCRKMAGRNKSIMLTGLAVACAMLVGTTVSLMQAVRATQAEQVAGSRFLSEQKARLAEKDARTDAEQAKTLAEGNAAAAYRQQYKAEMPLGLVDLEAGNLSRLYITLVEHFPGPQRADQRGWEWYYLLSRCQEGRTLCEHYRNVSSLAWSPDGRYLATTSFDGDAVVWDAQTGQRVRRFSFGFTWKRGVAWSPDSQRLAWGSVHSENAVRIWDRRTDEVRILRGNTYSLISCVWSPDGSRLATTAMDNTARIWDAATGASLHVLRGHLHHVKAACWMGDSKSLVTAGYDGVKVWDAQSGELLREVLTETTFSSASISATLPQRLVLGEKGQCRLINTATWQATHEIPAHAGAVNAVAFSPDGATFASGGADGTAIVSDAADGRQLYVLRSHHGQVISLGWNPGGNQLATGYADGRIKLWDVPAQRQPLTFQAMHETIQSLTWSKDDRLLTSQSVSTRTKWNRATMSAVETTSIAAETQEAMSPDGRMRASTTGSLRAFKILVQNVERGETLCELPFYMVQEYTGKALPKIVWSPDSRRLAVFEFQHFDVWEIPGGHRLFTWEGPAIYAASWASDGTRLAIAGGGDSTGSGYQAYQGFVHVFDVVRKIRLSKVGLASERVLATTVAWHPDEESFAAGNENGLVGVWDATTGSKINSDQLHVSTVTAMDWTPDGRRIASVSEDGSLKVWNPLTGDELLSLEDGKQPLTAVKWSSGGTRLVASDKQGKIQVWDASAGFALTSSPDHHRSLARIHQERAQQRLDSADLPGAFVELSRAIELAPSSASYRLSRAAAYARQGQLDEALADLTAAHDLDPDDTKVLRYRLDLYAELGRWTEALADASRLVELKQDPFYRYQQAVIHLMLGAVEPYREICDRAFVGDPDELIYAEETRAWTCALVPDAVADFERMLPLVRESLKGATDPSLGSVGGLLYRAGHVEEAVEYLSKASRAWEQSGSINLPSNYIDRLPGYIWYFLAMACHDLGRFTESRSWYDKAEAYTQAALARPTASDPLDSSNWLRQHAVNWHQRVVLEMLQRETRTKLGIADAK